MTKDEIILAQQSRIEQLKSSVQWALSNINCEPFEWTCEEDSDAHRHAIEALSTPDDLSALREVIARVLEEIDTMRGDSIVRWRTIELRSGEWTPECLK